MRFLFCPGGICGPQMITNHFLEQNEQIVSCTYILASLPVCPNTYFTTCCKYVELMMRPNTPSAKRLGENRHRNPKNIIFQNCIETCWTKHNTGLFILLCFCNLAQNLKHNILILFLVPAPLSQKGRSTSFSVSRH